MLWREKIRNLAAHLNTTTVPLAMDWSRYIKYIVPAAASVAALGAIAYFAFGTEGVKKISSNALLVAYLKEKRHIQASAVEAAMLKVDRARYVHGQDEPYEDKAQPIGFNATLSAPHMHAIGLEILSEVIKPGAHVLDVGAGSGYMSACFAHLVGPTGHVYGVEHIAELVEQAHLNIQAADPNIVSRITIKAGDGFAGWEEHGPYDAIYVGAAAAEIPRALIDQLREGGRLLLPVGPSTAFHRYLQVDKLPGGEITVKDLGTVRFTPLIDQDTQRQDQSRGARTKVTSLGEGAGQALVVPQVVPAPDTTPEQLQLLVGYLNTAPQNPAQ
jgi:protein-L-isoaspartate(D-aspartate) O-methyltransferase